MKHIKHTTGLTTTGTPGASHKPVLVLSLIAALLGGCGGGGSDSAPVTSTPVVVSNVLEKSSYAMGSRVVLPASSSPYTQVSLLSPAGVKLAPLKVDAANSVWIPVLPADQAGSQYKLSLTNASGTTESTVFEIKTLDVGASTPGLTTKIYLDASIVNLQGAIDELVSLGNSSTGPEITEAQKALAPLVSLRDAVVLAMAGTVVPIATDKSGAIINLDTAQLRNLDQYFAALLNTTAPVVSTTLQSSGLQVKQERLELRRAMPTVDCSALTRPDDRAWCANMRVRIANDLIINYAGMVGTAAGGVAAGLGALAAVGVAGVAFPATILGVVAVGSVIVANSVGAAIQGASASGTGTSAGTAFKDNITNLIGAGKDLLTGPLSKLIPSGSSKLVESANEAMVSAVGEKVMDKVEAFINKNTNVVRTCSAAANSGGRGSFAQRYDFGAPGRLVLSYDAFTIPDQFQVFDASGQVAATAGLVSGSGVLSFTSTSSWVTVKVNAPTENTAWNYSLNCGS